MNRDFILPEEEYGPFLPYVKDKTITDIDWNGEDLWLKNVRMKKWKVENPKITKEFIDSFATRVGILIGDDLNVQNPKLEGETENLRITVTHSSVAVTGTSVLIRKTPPKVQIEAYKAIQDRYIEEKVLHLLANFAKAGINIVFCGQPAVGKTECGKFFSTFIPADDKVITVEDRLEFRYREINPGKNCVSLRITDQFSFEEALKIVLAMNPDRVMLTEVRSKEVKYLLQCWSSGITGFTTIHTDDVRNISDRLLNMMPTRQDAERLVNNVYESLDCGVLVDTRLNKETGENERYINQVGFFYREKGKNNVFLAVKDGELIEGEETFLPDSILVRLKKKGITDPFYCEEAEQRIEEEKKEARKVHEEIF